MADAELSPETLELLEKAGIEQDETIKEAIEAVETIIENVEMRAKLVLSMLFGAPGESKGHLDMFV
ncbi:MAG: hypothetical protein QXH30_01730 [Candidatus Bilamarchaeaceae archaeon]